MNRLSITSITDKGLVEGCAWQVSMLTSNSELTPWTDFPTQSQAMLDTEDLLWERAWAKTSGM